MKSIKHPGICKICGQFKELTDEHIPPKNAFNKTNVTILEYEDVIKLISGADDRMPWDTNGIKGTIQQGGYKKHCLCRECNNNTGQWYMKTYTDFVHTIHSIIQHEHIKVGSLCSFIIKDIYPLRLYKAMLTMICDINNDCLGDDSLRKFILDKECNEFNSDKYSLYMYMVSSQMPRQNSLSAKVDIYDKTRTILVTEIASYPIGFALYLNKHKDYTPFGLSADSLLNCDYNTKCDLHFGGMPYLDINSQLPADYRSKEEIIQCIKISKKDAEYLIATNKT